MFQTHLGIVSLRVLVFTFLVCDLSSCKQDRSQEEGFVLRVRIKDEPDCLNPIVSQSGTATQIESMIMLPFIEYDPENLLFSPLLVDKLSEEEMINDSTVCFRYHIRDQAKWDDGQPVTADDYIFTVKAALNPCIKNTNLKSTLQNITNAEGQGKNIAVFIRKNYLLSQEISGNINIYPSHIYDPQKLMSSFSIQDLVKKDSATFTQNEWNILRSFATQFQSDSLCRNFIQGAGPYTLLKWESGSKVILEKKKNWWGNIFADSIPLLSNYPDRIEYVVIPEEASAVAGLKDGSIDLAGDINFKSFQQLRADSTYTNTLHFISNPSFGYNFIDLNTRRPGLDEPKVRWALAHLLDVDNYIKNLLYGLATPVTSPVHPTKTYYNTHLPKIGFDLEKAKQLLQEAGWSDSDRDGILDKVTKSGKIKLSFSFLVAAELGQKIALLFQEEAKKVGIEIRPEKTEMGNLLKAVNARNFDMVALNLSHSPSPYDPFQSWHSSNALPGGSNRCGFINKEIDDLIDRIQHHPEDRQFSYLRFQEIIYENQPQLFLFSPNSRLISSKKIQFTPTIRKPGFVENLIQKAPDLVRK